MDKDKFIKEIKKIFSDKKMNNLLIIVLVLAFVLIAVSSFSPSLFNSMKKDDPKVITENDDQGTKPPTSTSTMSYEEKEKKDLEEILSNIDGVGEVNVKMTFESGEEKVLAYDNTSQVSTTEETDTQGGKRINNQETGGSTVVMSNSGSETEPFITKTNKPRVIGVLITAEGAENSKVKYNIEKAVSSLFDISADKVNVYPTKK